MGQVVEKAVPIEAFDLHDGEALRQLVIEPHLRLDAECLAAPALLALARERRVEPDTALQGLLDERGDAFAAPRLVLIAVEGATG